MSATVRHAATCGRRCRPGRLATVLLVAVLALPALAAARSRSHSSGRERERPSAESLEKSTQHLTDARAALKGRDLTGAYRLAALAFREAPSPEALFVLGQVALAEGRPVDAQDLMRRYLADPNLDAGSDADEPKEAARILELPRPAAGQLSILGDRGALVTIDDHVVGALPLVRPLLVAPGEHRVLLERGSARLEDQVRITVGRLGELRCNFASKALVLTLLPGVLWVNDASQLTTAEQTGLSQAVEKVLLKQRLSPIGLRDAAECGEPAPGGCSEAGRCQLLSAQRCEADYVLRTQMRRSEPPVGRLHVELELVDVAVGETAAREASDCTPCTVAQATAKLSDKLPALVGKALERPRGRIEVTSEPAGAAVRLDGHLLGMTPYQAVIWAGSHQLTLKKEGFEEHAQPIEASDGQTRQLAVSLVALPPPPVVVAAKPVAPPPTRPLWRLLGGGIALGAGAVLVGFGISALAVNGNCVDQPFTRNATCTDIYATRSTGGALVGVGGAIMIGGAVLIALPPRSHSH